MLAYKNNIVVKYNYNVLYLMVPEISTSESRVPRTFANDTCTKNRNNLAERTGVVPAEYPPKVKLELYAHCSRVLERVNYAYLE